MRSGRLTRSLGLSQMVGLVDAEDHKAVGAEIEFIDAIPRNPSGKILRRVLKDLERQRMGLS